MPSFWDLLPPSAWPTQPFIPPFDPTQARAWPPAALPQWNPATSPAYGWSMVPAASVGMPPDAASAPPWDSAMPQGLATQAGGTGDADPVDQDPRVVAAKRAYDFGQWMFGPPSALQSPSVRATAITGTPLNASLPTSGEADQSAGLGAATGNPNIERQGARIRAAAAARPAPPPFVSDILPEVDQAGADALHDINAAFNPYSTEAIASHQASAQARTPREAVAAQWEDKKRIARGILGIPEYFFAPITGTARSVIGHPLADLVHFGGTLIAPGIAAKDDPARLYADAKHAVDQAMLTLGQRGGAPRAPLLSAARALPPPGDSIVGRSMGIPQVSAKSVRPAPLSPLAARSGPLQLELPLPAPPEGLATVADEPALPLIGPGDLANWRAHIGAPTIDTVGVARTNVPGVEDMIFKGASPAVRKLAGLPPAEPGPIESPFPRPRQKNHAEEDLANQFHRAVEALGLLPKDLEGRELNMYLSQPSCPWCRSGIDSNAIPGVLKQLSKKYSLLTIRVGANAKEGVRGPTHFTIRDGSYINRSDQ